MLIAVAFGRAGVLVALLLSLYGALAGWRGREPGALAWQEAARRAVLAVAALLTLSMLTLWGLLFTRQFQVAYVAQVSSHDLSFLYTVAALWGGNAGSLLLWSWILSLYAAAVVWRPAERSRYLPYVIAVLLLVQAFFLVLVGFVDSPYRLLPSRPADGQGINALLRDPYMALHPPPLYLGYVGWSVPFAFAMAALLRGDAGDEWLRHIRRWTLVPWVFLSIGLVLGAMWAYHVLGWGGYWGWDPVENAALLPWLTGTAFLHSVIIQERRGMFRIWNIVLIIATFGLSIFGTFLTRTGLIASVHAFARSAIGYWFIGFMALALGAAIVLLIRRLPGLRSETELESMLSRESAFLFNNLVFVAIAFAVLWGTVFPLISEAFRGVKITVGPPYYRAVVGPTALGLLVLMAVGPVLPWRKARPRQVLRELAPSLPGALAGAIPHLLGYGTWLATLLFALLGFLLVLHLREFYLAGRIRRRATGEGWLAAIAGTVGRMRSRYGGYLVHIGIVLMGFGLVASQLYQEETAASVAPGGTLDVGRYRLVFQGLRGYQEPARETVLAPLLVYRDGRPAGEIFPGRHLYFRGDQPVTQVAIRANPVEDLYVILAGWEGERATFRAFVNPLVPWLWTGAWVLVLGTVVAAWPSAAPAPAQALGGVRHEILATPLGAPAGAGATAVRGGHGPGRGPTRGADVPPGQEAVLPGVRAAATGRLRDPGLPGLEGPHPAEAPGGGERGADRGLLRGALRAAGSGLAAAAGLQLAGLGRARGGPPGRGAVAGAPAPAVVGPAPGRGDPGAAALPLPGAGRAGGLRRDAWPALRDRLRPAAPYLVTGLLLASSLAFFGDVLTQKLGGQLTSGPAPEFTLPLFDGGTLSSQDLRGKVVVINFWASWCTECRQEAPTLQKVWERYRDRGVVLVGVNYVDREDLARAYMREFGFTFPNGPDVGQRIARAFRMLGVPETFFVDRNWTLRGVHIGRSTEADLVRRIEELLAEGEGG